MAAVRVQAAASFRLDEIYRYTRDRWGTERADDHIIGLFEAFDKIVTHGVISKSVPARVRRRRVLFSVRTAFRQLAIFLKR
jgi:plasmid stabilization system protein ParE